MHEVSAVRAAVEAAAVAAEAAGARGRVTEVRLSVGGHMAPGQIVGLFELLSDGTALQGAAVVATRDESLGEALRVDSVVVGRTGSA